MKPILLFVAILLALPVSQAASCNSRLQTQMNADYQKLLQSYRKIDPQFQEILELNRPRWVPGTKREVIFVAHGFMGSPDEMKWVAEPLHRQGFSVFMGLIPGYGASSRIANQSTYDHYRNWYREQIQMLAQCYGKIHLVGFSTGALLAFDYASSHPEDSHIASVNLISPFFSSHSLWGSLLQKIASKVIDQISVADLNAISHFPDIQVMIKNPKAYLADVPLRAASQIVDGGERNLNRKISRKISTPVLLFLSDRDQIVNQQESESLIRNTFSQISFVHYTRSQGGPHHLMSPLVSSVAGDVAQKITQFVKTH